MAVSSLSCGWVMQSLVQVHRPIFYLSIKSRLVYSKNEYRNGRALQKTEELASDVSAADELPMIKSGRWMSCDQKTMSLRLQWMQLAAELPV